MNRIIWIVGLVVIVLLILGFPGLRRALQSRSGYSPQAGP